MSRIDDCSLWQAVWLAPNAVRRILDGGSDTDGVDGFRRGAALSATILL
ncbi:hypothetical protein ACFV83_05920 [Streptomyces pharetrae]